MAGTIFQDTHIPLTIWFRAMWLLVTHKIGTNAMTIHRSLGVSYSSSWEILHKLRRAMVRTGRETLSGTVEVDEAFYGAEEEGQRGRRADEKALLIIAVEVKGKSIGRARLKIIESASSHVLLQFIKENIKPGSKVVTDGWRGYSKLNDKGYEHEVKIMKDDKKALPHVHLVISLLKRWLLGTYQGAMNHNQLDHYLDEFIFRFNRRTSKSRGMLFMRLVEQAVQTPPVTGKELVKETKITVEK
jgi:transposase-like protein